MIHDNEPGCDDAACRPGTVLAGHGGEPEIARAAATAPLPLIAFDRAQAAALGERQIHVVSPHAPVVGVTTKSLLAGSSARSGSTARPVKRWPRAPPTAAMVVALRRLGDLDAHGDRPDPAIWLRGADAA